ncbi:MAG: DUF1853 family protein [Paraburkholderia sp.]|uniref:DUF1853 family protein n=2 Tax=Paraburkholderia sp. TaxID=1926495 RepID=UPI0012234449|nr:DUF1853 family protein [Paraburkholderia sp.]TAM32488.1 MAG: DUF1853 family protein [Paraburkholderia sp.]
MTAAQPSDTSGVDVAGRLDGLTDPAVRDLAWLLFSADLLSAQPPRSPLAEPWSHPAEAHAAAQWLIQLDRDPAPLHAVLDGSRPKRLGRYAEILLGWFLEYGPAARLVAANVPLRRAGHTLGECDFLVETRDGQRLHWELAVKCYLHCGDAQATLADFVGPGLRDRLDRKRTHLIDHQLRLSEREEFVSLGFPGPWIAQMFVKGWLFYQAGASAPAAVNDPPALARGHARGWWVTRTEWPAFAARQAADGWSALPRMAWLAPRRIADGKRESSGMAATARMQTELSLRAGRSGEGSVDLPGAFADQMSVAAPGDPETLLADLPRPDEPAMVAAFVADAANRYIEQSRGFIVPDDWPAQARAFARE